MVIALGSQGGAGATPQSVCCGRLQVVVVWGYKESSATQNPNSTLLSGITASMPKEHDLGQPRFLGGAEFPGCLFSYQ